VQQGIIFVKNVNSHEDTRLLTKNVLQSAAAAITLNYRYCNIFALLSS